MPPRDARRSSIPFAVVMAIFAVVAATAWLHGGRGGADAGTEAVSGAGGGSSTVSTSGRADDTVDDSPDGPEAATSPTPIPTTTPTPEPKQKLVIHGTGDVSLDPSYIPALRENGYDWAWSGLDGLFQRDDLTIVNHECPSTEIVAPLSKTFVFRCDPAALDEALHAGVEVANLANNHGYDQGSEGLLDSIRNLRRAGLVAVGAGRDAAQADAPHYIEVKGWRIAIVGVGEVLDPVTQVAAADRPGTAVGHEFGRALRAIREAEANADLVLVTIHWGVELDTQPRDYQVQEARAMIGAGADVIFGHHSHRLQPMDTYEGRPIFYGLGNFVWPRFSVEGATTAVARVVVRPDGTITGQLMPAEIVSDGHPVLR
jgi:poly-gamma-glutamate synthesis protein (capsule biosynthesis protein)